MSKAKAATTAKAKLVTAVDLVPMQAEVQRVFHAVRDAANPLLEGQSIRGKAITLPVIDVVVNVDAIPGTRKRRATVLGHFSADRFTDNGTMVHQIALSPYFMGGDVADIVGTLAHEYLHLVAECSGIAEVSRQNRFHNAKFGALVALVPNLIVEGERSKQIGVTTVTSEACRTWCAEELMPNFSGVAKLLESAPSQKPPTTVRFKCVDCGMKATVSAKQAGEGFAPLCDYGHDPEPMTPVKR